MADTMLLRPNTANLRTKILYFRGFDSNIISISRGGILRSVGTFLEDLSQQIIAGTVLVGRSGVPDPVQAQNLGIPVVSLVGYTNTGKSSLLNRPARTPRRMLDAKSREHIISIHDASLPLRMVVPSVSAVLGTAVFLFKVPEI